ncbi:hypothetical protein VNO80_28858 [Phaseolus coccineus]|uniref:Transmembrane protein n=1 Tax=Phaseolus coccineus TaxID=3886 RepID=A0AAN9LB58_PHACN
MTDEKMDFSKLFLSDDDDDMFYIDMHIVLEVLDEDDDCDFLVSKIKVLILAAKILKIEWPKLQFINLHSLCSCFWLPLVLCNKLLLQMGVNAKRTKTVADFVVIAQVALRCVLVDIAFAIAILQKWMYNTTNPSSQYALLGFGYNGNYE